MTLPVHRWYRYSAGFSADWVESVILSANQSVSVFDPFAGSATTLIAAENVGVQSVGIEAHPFVYRIAHAKLCWRSDPEAYRAKIEELERSATEFEPTIADYPELMRRCYDDNVLSDLDALRRAYERIRDDSAASELVWLTLVTMLRRVSKAGTAQWQYVLPNKTKRAPLSVARALRECSAMIYADMRLGGDVHGPHAGLILGDARECTEVPNGSVNLVITSPPYPNNYDYADATRLEMTFLKEITGWGDLQQTVRRHLVRSCSQHVPEKSIDLRQILTADELCPIKDELAEVCNRLSEVRETKGGRKTYHLMVACYFRDLARVWKSLRRVCASPSTVCFVIGDSAPYGVYVPVVPWLERLALSSGFKSAKFEKTRDRNVKWKNRKHRVPLKEGRLWISG